MGLGGQTNTTPRFSAPMVFDCRHLRGPRSDMAATRTVTRAVGCPRLIEFHFNALDSAIGWFLDIFNN